MTATPDAWDDAVEAIRDELDAIEPPQDSERVRPWVYDGVPGARLSRIFTPAGYHFSLPGDEPSDIGIGIMLCGRQSVYVVQAPNGQWRIGRVAVGGWHCLVTGVVTAGRFNAVYVALTKAEAEMHRLIRIQSKARLRVVGDE